MTLQMPLFHIHFLKFATLILALLTLCVSISTAAPLIPVHNLSITFDLKNHQMVGVSRIELPAEASLDLRFDLLVVTEITLNGKQPVAELTDSHLTIPSSAKAQEIVITYVKTDSADGTDNCLIDSAGIALTNIWHPIADQDMLFKLTAVIPAGFSAVSEAEEVIIFPNSPDTTSKQVLFRFPHPLRALHFVAGPYVVVEETFSDGKVLSSLFFPEDQELAQSYREKARGYLDRYEKLLGPYPYRRFAIVENRLPTGFAMQTFTLLGQSVVRLPFIKDTSLGHEVLHAWFGNSIRTDSEGGNWAEGLTAYLADHAFAQDENRDSIFRKEQLIKYRSYVHDDASMALEEFTGAADELPTKNTIRAIGYSKSSMFFHMLKNMMGEKIFQAALRDFYSRMKYQTAGWSDVRASFEKVSQMKLETFFDQWLTRTDIPVLTAQQIKVVESDGQPLLSFQLVQENKKPYQLSVPISIHTTTGQIKKNYIINEPQTFIDISLPAPPLELVIDAGYDLMRRLEYSELPPTWSRFAGAADKRAILADGEDAEALYAPLIGMLEDMDCRIIHEGKATDEDLSSAAVIFLGADNAVSRTIFARPPHPSSGFTVDIRNNPLNPEGVTVLISSSSREETGKSIAKLAHYGKYSYLHFANGRIQDKRIRETVSGIKFPLVELPSGVATSATRTFQDIMEELLDSRVIYVGEMHTSYEDHILQLRILRSLYERDPRLAIGMEMFPRSNQPILDDFTAGRLDEKTFLKKSEYYKKWGFDYRLYRDIINFARYHQVPIIALNLEKETVSSIYKNGGTDSLNKDEKEGLTKDRDLDMPGYRERLTSVYQLHSTPDRTPGKQFSGFVQAQALWDETMAESVADYLVANPDDRMVVLAGRGHTLKDSAIPPRVYRRIPVKQSVALNASGHDLNQEEADYLFFSPEAALPPPALLGVMLEDVGEDHGATVANLVPEGQAQSAGIKKQDVIIAIDDEPVNSVEDVKIIMLYKENYDSVQVVVKRPHTLLAEEELKIEVQLKKKQPPH